MSSKVPDKNFCHGQAVGTRMKIMLRFGSPAVAVFAMAQTLTLGVLPSQAAQNCGPHAHWVQTGAGLGSGYCKHKHHRDHFVCAIGYHYAGQGRCVRNGPWWTGRRPINWGPHYEPRNKSGSVTFEGPNGGEIKLRW